MTTGRPTFVGIGAGAIQLGLWGYFAHLKRAGIVLAEVDLERVRGIRKNRGRYTINIARAGRISRITVGPVAILNPRVPADRARLLDSIRIANDIVTAVPSTTLYEKGGVAKLLRAGLSRRTGPVLVYASENRIGAARMLRELVFPGRTPRDVRFLETVIERMGGPHPAGRFGLKAIAPALKQALLVEDFRRIIVSKPRLRGHATIFDMFRPVPDVLPYEELKLYGHNAVHFLLGVLAKLKGYSFMSEFRRDPDFRDIGVRALIEETGGWFRKRYAPRGIAEATGPGYRAWAGQLTARIVNPLLHDPVARVIREPERKLGWDDRIVGTMARALGAGIVPKRYALGVAGALLLQGTASTSWGKAGPARIRTAIMDVTADAFDRLGAWRRSGESSLSRFLRETGYFS